MAVNPRPLVLSTPTAYVHTGRVVSRLTVRMKFIVDTPQEMPVVVGAARSITITPRPTLEVSGLLFRRKRRPLEFLLGAANTNSRPHIPAPRVIRPRLVCLSASVDVSVSLAVSGPIDAIAPAPACACQVPASKAPSRLPTPSIAGVGALVISVCAKGTELVSRPSAAQTRDGLATPTRRRPSAIRVASSPFSPRGRQVMAILTPSVVIPAGPI